MIVGIDPGLSGALAVMDPRQPAAVEVIDVPVHVLERGKVKCDVDIAGLVGLLTLRPIAHAFVEAVNAMPGQGVVSMFSFGKVFGIILGILGALGVPTTLAAPVSWKRALQVPKGKHAARARASQLFPAAACQWRLSKHDGRAEAALIALFGARQLSSHPIQSFARRGAGEKGDGRGCAPARP